MISGSSGRSWPVIKPLDKAPSSRVTFYVCFVWLPVVWVCCSAAFPCSPRQVSEPRVSLLPRPCGSDSWDKCLLTWFCKCSFSQHPFSNPIWFTIHLSKSRRCLYHAGFLRCYPKLLYLSKRVATFAIIASAAVLTSHETSALMWRPKGTVDNRTPCSVKVQILCSESFHTGNSESSSQVAQADPQLEIWRCTLKAPLDLSVVWNLLCIHHHEHRGLGGEKGSNEGQMRPVVGICCGSGSGIKHNFYFCWPGAISAQSLVLSWVQNPFPFPAQSSLSLQV